MRVQLDDATRREAGDMLLGGRPRHLLRLSADGRRALRELCAGDAESLAARVLGRRLLDRGLAHPRPRPVTGLDGVTVVIPVRDRAAQLDRCLGALGGLSSVIVVDDASRDRDKLARVVSRHGARLLRLDDHGGPAAARNAALRVLNTEFIAFLDSDCEPPADWLSVLLGHFEDPMVAAVAPRVRPRTQTPGGTVARYLQSRSPLDMGLSETAVRPGALVSYVPTAALLVRRAALAGEFDERLRYGEDVDLIWRLCDAGWTVRYDPSVAVTHEGPATLRAALGRRMRYGTSAAPLRARHPGKLAPAVVHSPGVAVVVLALARAPLSAVAVGTLDGAAFVRRRHRLGVARPMAARWFVQGLVESLLSLARYAATLALPLALAVAWRQRRIAPLALLGLPALREWSRGSRELDPIRWAALAMAEDLAYAAGVWGGCIRAREPRPLLPRVLLSSAVRNSRRGSS
jgi:mycofactocin system glycosyltransferase